MQNYNLISTFICKGKNLGIHGNLFGGDMMANIDEAAATYACMYCDSSRMVTLKVSELLFIQPVKLGELVKIYGRVKKLGNTSITLDILVNKHNPINSVESKVTSAELVFVQIDTDGNSVPINENIQKKFKIRKTLIREE